MENVNLLPSDEYTEVEERAYLNPNLSIRQANEFIENYRANQQAANQEIAQQTKALGTSIPSDEGGLLGAGSYWTSRYQTPQTNTVAQNLRTAAQASALNQALANEQAMWKKRYQDAYKNYQKKQYDAAKRASSGGGGTGGNGSVEGMVEYEDTSNSERTVGSVEPSYSPMGSGDFNYEPNTLPSGGVLSGGGVLPSSGSLTPSGSVNIQRDKFGNITSLSYDGHNFTGDAAKTRYQWLLSTGAITGKR